MTSMPQLVSLFNAVGGGAAALIAIADYDHDPPISAGTATATVLDVVIGGITFSGSLIAAAKLQGGTGAARSRCPAAGCLRRLLLAAVGAGIAVIAGGPEPADLGDRRSLPRSASGASWCCRSAAPTCRW